MSMYSRHPGEDRCAWENSASDSGTRALPPPKSMRHTPISLWISAGIDVEQVSTFAGHTSVSFTLDTYGHLYPHSGETFIRKLNLASAAAFIPEREGTLSGHDGADGLAKVMAIRPDLENDGGASKNRTYDLSIISEGSHDDPTRDSPDSPSV